MDALVQKLGIDASHHGRADDSAGLDDTETYQQSVAYWTFRYWGFSRDRVKILNGGDDAWDVAGRPLTDAVLVPTASTYSVTGNKVLKDALRTSVGEMLAFVDSVNRDRSVLNTWQMLDVRGFATSPYIANAYRGNGGCSSSPTASTARRPATGCIRTRRRWSRAWRPRPGARRRRAGLPVALARRCS